MTVKDVVAERFRQLCAQRGIKYNELANLSGITPSTVYSLLDVRRRDISITTIKSCATGWISRWASFSQRLNSTPWNRNYNKNQRLPPIAQAAGFAYFISPAFSVCCGASAAFFRSASAISTSVTATTPHRSTANHRAAEVYASELPKTRCSM